MCFVFSGALTLALLASCGIPPETQTQIILPTETPEQPINLNLDETSTEFLVGSLGGSVSVQNIQISIPPGALHENTNIKVEMLSGEEQLPELPLYTNFLGAVSFAPDGLSFDQPIQVLIGLASPRDPGQFLSVYSKNADSTYTDTGLSAKVSEDGQHAAILLSHFSTYVILDGVTGSTLGRNFLDQINQGQKPETAYASILDYLKGVDLAVGNCLNGDRSIAGYMLDITYKSSETEYRDNVLIGVETQTVNINSMQYNVNEADHQIFVDILLVIYLEEKCPIIYTGMASYADKTDTCTCSDCGGQSLTAIVKIDDQDRVVGQLLANGWLWLTFSGTRESIRGTYTMEPNNCQAVCTDHLEASLVNNDQEFVGAVWEECTPGDCHFDECVGTYTFSLTLTEPDAETK